MTAPEDLIERLAREAGFTTGEDAVDITNWFDSSQAPTLNHRIAVAEYATGDRLARFAALVAEQCAQIAERTDEIDPGPVGNFDGAERAAAQIRAAFRSLVRASPSQP